MRDTTVTADRRLPTLEDIRSVGSPASWAVWLLTGVSGLVFYYFATLKTFDPALERPYAGWASRFYLAQADSMTHLHFYVHATDLPSECFYRAKGCFGYFGVTPSVLRLPFLPFMHAWDTSLTPLFVTAALTLAAYCSFRLVLLFPTLTGTTAFGKTMWVVLATILLCVGPGSILVQVARPTVYHEAIAWGAAFTLLMLLLAVRYRTEGTNRLLVGATVAGILAAGARPTAAVPPVILGLYFAFRAYRANKQAVRTIVLALLLAAAPGVSLAFVFWLKFRTVFPDIRMNEQIGDPNNVVWASILKINGDHTSGSMFLPTAAYSYLRPDSLHFMSTYPYVALRIPTTFLWPLHSGGAYIEPTGSVTATMPLLGALTCVSAVLAVLRRWARWTVPFLLAGLSMILPAITTVGITNRYLGDFFPLLVVGTAASVFYLASKMPRGRVPIGVLVVGLGLWSILINIALALNQPSV